MLTKLTLTIDESVVQEAKTYARSRHRSVSRLVEEYLRNIVSGGPETDSEAGAGYRAPVTESISGRFAAEYHGEDYGTLLDGALQERFL